MHTWKKVSYIKTGDKLGHFISSLLSAALFKSEQPLVEIEPNLLLNTQLVLSESFLSSDCFWLLDLLLDYTSNNIASPVLKDLSSGSPKPSESVPERMDGKNTEPNLPAIGVLTCTDFMPGL